VDGIRIVLRNQLLSGGQFCPGWKFKMAIFKFLFLLVVPNFIGRTGDMKTQGRQAGIRQIT